VPAIVPNTPQMVGDTAVLQSGALSLAGATYAVQLTLQISGHDQGTNTIDDSGTYSVNGDTITFTSSSGRQVTATLRTGGGMMATFIDPTYGTLSLTLSKQGGSHAC